MGGCRCSYRKCTMVTDAKTHFFHYPVVDKDRCYTWLINARRVDFMNLTKNQLKNRVVCQNHFVPKMFMNYRCDRLVYHAVPTEEGPSPPETEQETKAFVNIVSHISKNLWVFMDSENVSINQTAPVNKEDSILIVNDSPITGYSFTEPDGKKLKVAEPYIEFLTRKQIGLIDMAKRRLIEKSNEEGTKVSKVIKKANESNQLAAEIRKQESIPPFKISNDAMVPLGPSRSVKKASPKKIEPSTSIEISVLSDKMVTQPISIPSNATITPVRQVVPSFVLQKRLTLNDAEQVEPLSINMIRNEKTNIILNSNIMVNNTIPGASENYIEVVFPENISPENISENDRPSNCQKNSHIDNDIIETNSLNVPRLVRGKAVTNIATTQEIETVACKNENIIEAFSIEGSLQEEQTKEVRKVICSTLLKKIDDNTREIAELRRLLLKDSEERVAAKRKKEEDEYEEETVKLRLYKEISAFISPKLIKLVHDELFPSVIRYSESPKKYKLRDKRK